MRFLPNLLRTLLLSVLVSACWPVILNAQAIDYDIVAVKAPRYGDQTPTTWQEVDYAAAVEPGQDLVLIHPDGSEETLVSCAGGCAVVDPVMSLDGRSVYYSLYPDVTFDGFNGQRGLPYQGADIYRMDLSTRAITRLTNQEFTPNTGPVPWASDALNSRREQGVYRLGYGVLNLGPCPVPGPNPGEEWVAFVSSRNGFVPARGLTNPNLQLFIMDSSGNNVRFIGHMNLGSAMHPTLLHDGRVMFSSSEGQGNRDGRVWGLWSVFPDGRNFEPLMSAFADAAAFHFQSQLSSGDVVVTEYYNLNNNGFGTVLAFSSLRPAGGGPAFGSPVPGHASNPAVRRGYWYFQPGHPAHRQPRFKQYAFSPPGLRNLTAFSHGEDEASSLLPNGEFAGKATHPSGAPDNDLLLIYSPGPVNDLDRPVTVPRVWGGIYLLKGGAAVEDPSGLLLIKRDRSFNYQQPRAAVPWARIYGSAPAKIAFLPDGSTPYGLVGTASFYNRNTTPGRGVSSYNGLDPFNTAENGASTNWETQGGDAGLYTNSEIHAVRILGMEPSSHLSYGPDGYEHTRSFSNFAGERLRIIGEIPLRKGEGSSQPRDGDGNPDTSFLARMPADLPFTFQTLDKDGISLNMSQTWHQVRPGERRFDCGGCHAHSNTATRFESTVAGQPGYQVWDLIDQLPLITKDSSGAPALTTLTGAERKRRMDVEYLRDIKPIFQRSCVGCHTSKGGNTPAAQLDLDNDTLKNGYEQTFICLTDDGDAECGYKPVIPAKVWRQTNASRWVRKFQARRSLLVWKVFGRRLDGWRNEDHPTESLPGDATTLPVGASANEADLDYTGTIMPPPGSGAQPLSEDEKIAIARWIDLGAPGDRSSDALVSGWFVDEVRPVLNVALPRAEVMRSLSRLEIAAHDYYSGLDTASLSVMADFPVNGNPIGTELAPFFGSLVDGLWSLTLTQAITNLPQGRIIARVRDAAGNLTVQDVLFSVNEDGAPEPTPAPTPNGPSGSKIPKIKSKKVVKAAPGQRFVYKIRATNCGKSFKPIRYSANNLPRGLKVGKGGKVTGKLSGKKNFSFAVQASNKFGTSAPVTVKVRMKGAGNRPR